MTVDTMPQHTEGSLAMVPALIANQLPPGFNSRTGELYQLSLMNALYEGVYDGEVTYGALRQHGDFGLGTFNELDGEMVGFDGQFYQLRSNGSARPVDPEQKTPFAVLTFFKATLTSEITAPIPKAEMQQLIEELSASNLFQAVRIDGQFASVTTRTVSRQKKPYPKLSEATADQSTLVLNNVRGTLAGFRSPSYAQGIGVAGFHLHFLREDRQGGGHALDYILTEGQLRIAAQHELHVELPRDAEFERADLSDPSANEMVKKAEG